MSIYFDSMLTTKNCVYVFPADKIMALTNNMYNSLCLYFEKVCQFKIQNGGLPSEMQSENNLESGN